MKRCFDFSNISLFAEVKLICLNLSLNFVENDYGTFNELKILINSFFKKVKYKDEKNKMRGRE